MSNKANLNTVTLIGHVASKFKFDHTIYGTRYYIVELNVPRLSGNIDHIPVIVSEYVVDTTKDYIDKYIAISGYIRTYNIINENKSKLKLCVCAKTFEFVEKDYMVNNTNNEIILEGYICKKPAFRSSLVSIKSITELLIAVNRSYKYSDYIPCICWNNTAEFAKDLQIGSCVVIIGRIQSRDYIKKINNTEETRTTYEVSIRKLILNTEEETEVEEYV